MAAQTGELMLSSAQAAGTQDGYGAHKLFALPGSGINPSLRYALACFDTLDTRHYWVDTSVSLTNAPTGFNYVAATLVITGKF